MYFRGSELPGGEIAEKAYIILNDPYFQIINDTHPSPANYDYLLALQKTPAALRFYEFMRPRIFVTIKNDNPEAWVRYSEYCLYNNQTRKRNRKDVQTQIGRVLKPHKKSGYIEKIRWKETIDAEGRADWVMYFTPGPKAYNEYDAFNTRGLKRPKSATKKLESKQNDQHQPELDQVVQHFYSHVFGMDQATVEESDRAVARKILDAQGSLDDALFTIEFVYQEFPAIKTMKGILTANYLQRAREAGKSAQADADIHAAAFAAQQAEAALQEQYKQYRNAAINEYIQLNESQWNAILEKAQAKMETNPMRHAFSEDRFQQSVRYEAREEIERRLRAAGLLQSPDDWKARQASQEAV